MNDGKRLSLCFVPFKYFSRIRRHHFRNDCSVARAAQRENMLPLQLPLKIGLIGIFSNQFSSTQPKKKLASLIFIGGWT